MDNQKAKTLQNTRNHKCHTCNKAFRQAAKLPIIQQVKFNFRHHCDKCGKSFTEIEELECHERINS